MPQLLVKEPSHHFQCLLRLRQLEVIPERVRQGFEYQKLRIDARVQECEMEHCRITQQQIARAGHQEAGRPSMQVGEKRREHWIFRIGFANVTDIVRLIYTLRLDVSREAVQCEKLL